MKRKIDWKANVIISGIMAGIAFVFVFIRSIIVDLTWKE